MVPPRRPLLPLRLQVRQRQRLAVGRAQLQRHSVCVAAHPVPEPLGDEVLIKVDSVAICGSDIALYNWSEVAQV